MSVDLVIDQYPLTINPLPEGWGSACLGDVVQLVASGFPSGEHNQDRRGVPHLRPMNIDREGRLDLSVVKYVEGEVRRLLKRGDVLFNNTNSPELIGKTTAFLVEGAFAYSNHMTCLRLEPGLDAVFVARQLHFLWMSGYFRHRCVNHVNQASISVEPLSTTVPILVAPSNEQTRISDGLDELLSDLDAGVAALERAGAKLARYRAAVLKAAVDGTLTAEWRQLHPFTEHASQLLERILSERRRRWEEEQLSKYSASSQDSPRDWKAKYKGPPPPDTSKLPSVPHGWCWAAIAQCGEVRLGRQRAPQHHHGDHMRPYLRVANVYEDRIDTSDVKEMNFTPAEFETYALRYGDVLLNEGQSPELVGRPAMYRDEVPGCCYQKTLLRFRAFAGVEPDFALSVFRSYLHNGRFRQSANITTSIAHLAAERFVVIEFPLPPQEEQRAIVEAVEDQLSVIDHLEGDLETKLKSAQALRQAILRHAFTGQLVPQDPNDEPASELLKRIAAQRELRPQRPTALRNRTKTAGARRAAKSRSPQ